MDSPVETVVGETLVDGTRCQVRETEIDGLPSQITVHPDGSQSLIDDGQELPTTPIALVTPEKLAAFLSVTERTLRRWEMAGNMPKALRFGDPGRPAVRYAMPAILAWLKNPAHVHKIRSADFVGRTLDAQADPADLEKVDELLARS